MARGSKMKITIITDVLNSKDTMEEAILSVLNQTYKDIQYIIIDGKSTDGTLDIINRYQSRISEFISEPDNNHFEAMNKGLRLTKGDIVGFLHADDIFASDNIIEKVANIFMTENIDCLWGDLVYTRRNDNDKIIRYWKSSPYKKGLFKKGWMPPHPTLFVKKSVYEKYGYFNTDLEISADYEIMLRFLHVSNISSYYLPEVLVKMRLGGLSNRSLKHIVKKSMEDLTSWKTNGLDGGVGVLVAKNISKISQFFVR